ncbi:hypothetical protein FRACYDRAFT_267187 [Fragilariopsis cylindrus CCMP1102]|uniref:ER membrane protein complex subunit 10 n=1 Tax=Fragilariopsis cylindrus CCMP1102 TaxID=635003 RepID=A0A1E7FVN2_9STRA|nr:hypothetical protein FRACYDRAFT_267187 [Fragilariopsis cylindrus CCMP1102]|eukprot:OEU22209.1 hypothetical protein FRACYDRAFT_267187 [Fragilariopsis cylindrus CCMP1102]
MMVPSLLQSLSVTTLALVLLVAVAVPGAAAEDAAGLSWSIFHSWKPDQSYVRRGTLSWNPENDDPDKKSSSTVFEIINDDASTNLTAKDIKDMLDYGWYHVKIQGDTNDNFVFQTVPACNLQRANFKDQFDITLPRSSLGDQQDPITSFAYTPLVSPLAPKSCDNKYETNDDDNNKIKTFSSRVNVQLDTAAMALKNVLSQSKPPPGLAFMKQPQQPGEQGSSSNGGGGGDEEQDPNAPPNAVPSPFAFLQKYWYIILPMIILQFITGPAEEPKSQGPDGNEGGEQSTNNAISTGDGDKKTARRGKRSSNKK